MIEVKKLIRLVRFKQKDNDEVRFSDYDIINSLNECIRYVNQSFVLKNSDFLEKVCEYREDELNAALAPGEARIEFSSTGVDLPDDFISLVNIVRMSDNYKLSPVPVINDVTGGTYKIFANKLYCKAASVKMLYRGTVDEVAGIDDSVMLPETFTDSLVKITGLILNNAETDILTQAVNDNINNIVPARRYSNVKIKMPFMV